MLLYDPSYLDLSWPDYFMFLKLKLQLKGQTFHSITDIQMNVTTELKVISQEQFSVATEKLKTQAYVKESFLLLKKFLNVNFFLFSRSNITYE